MSEPITFFFLSRSEMFAIPTFGGLAFFLARLLLCLAPQKKKHIELCLIIHIIKKIKIYHIFYYNLFYH
jgi:hypothetical protein